MVSNRTIQKLQDALAEFKNEAGDDPKFKDRLDEIKGLQAALSGKDPESAEGESKDAQKSTPGELFDKASEGAKSAFQAFKKGQTTTK